MTGKHGEIGLQLSASWRVAQAVNNLTTSVVKSDQLLGNALRCAEVLGFHRVDETKRQKYSQGLEVILGFYCETDKKLVDLYRLETETTLARAFGLWWAAIQLDLRLLDNSWLGFERPYERGGDGRRLDRYFSDAVLSNLLEKPKGIDFEELAERKSEVRILLRRIRYRLEDDFGKDSKAPSYAFWTTPTTAEWAKRNDHKLNNLVRKISEYSDNCLKPGSADLAFRDTNYWGEVDTEADPLRVLEITTASGVTETDVETIFKQAGNQLQSSKHKTTGTSVKDDPVRFFTDELCLLLETPEILNNIDVLFLHRGGGINETTDFKQSNISAERKQNLFTLCQQVCAQGVEVVVAMGHADVSVLPIQASGYLPLGIFEATTPTAGAIWILQEHINNALIDSSVLFSQSKTESNFDTDQS